MTQNSAALLQPTAITAPCHVPDHALDHPPRLDHPCRLDHLCRLCHHVAPARQQVGEALELELVPGLVPELTPELELEQPLPPWMLQAFALAVALAVGMASGARVPVAWGTRWPQQRLQAEACLQPGCAPDELS